MPSAEGFAVRPFNASLPGEEGFVFCAWMHSWRRNYTPWPSLSEWDSMDRVSREDFTRAVKGTLPPSRVSREHRALWIQSQENTVRFWIEQGDVRVAHPEGEPNVLVGFVVFPKALPILKAPGIPAPVATRKDFHPVYVCVSKALWGQGIGSMLAERDLRSAAKDATLAVEKQATNRTERRQR